MREIQSISTFIAKHRSKTLAYLRNKFTQLTVQDTEDVYQDASIVLFENVSMGKLKDLTCELYTYFLRICINLCLKMVYRNHRMPMLAIGSEETGYVSDARLEKCMRIYEHEGNTDETNSKLANVILAEMNEKCRRLMVGYYMEGRSWADIASEYNLSDAGSARYLAFRYRRKLQHKFNALRNRFFND